MQEFTLGQRVRDKGTGEVGIITYVEEHPYIPHLTAYHVDHGDHVLPLLWTRLEAINGDSVEAD